MTYQKLQRKLSRIKALEERSSSYGERVAAKHAKERIQRRINQRTDAEFLKNESTQSFDDIIFQTQTAPTRMEIITKLKSWQDATLSQKDLVVWARDIVDKITFDDLSPEDPDSIPIELIMICSAMDRRIWSQTDIAALMEFAQSPPEESSESWRRWFAHVHAHF